MPASKKKLTKKKTKDDVLSINAQLVGFKNLKATGGWRLEIDLFESELKDILSVTALVNRQEVVKLEIRPAA